MVGRAIGSCVAIGIAMLSAAACSLDSPVGPQPIVTANAVVDTVQAQPPFVFPATCCYYNGTIVRTVVPPSAAPQEGRDNFYAISNGVAVQKGVVAVAPGDTGYHGGHWKFHSVTFLVAPYLLTSEDAVLAAAASGDVTITRVPEKDFRCPIQP